MLIMEQIQHTVEHGFENPKSDSLREEEFENEDNSAEELEFGLKGGRKPIRFSLNDGNFQNLIGCGIVAIVLDCYVLMEILLDKHSTKFPFYVTFISILRTLIFRGHCIYLQLTNLLLDEIGEFQKITYFGDFLGRAFFVFSTTLVFFSFRQDGILGMIKTVFRAFHEHCCIEICLMLAFILNKSCKIVQERLDVGKHYYQNQRIVDKLWNIYLKLRETSEIVHKNMRIYFYLLYLGNVLLIVDLIYQIVNLEQQYHFPNLLNNSVLLVKICVFYYFALKVSSINSDMIDWVKKVFPCPSTLRSENIEQLMLRQILVQEINENQIHIGMVKKSYLGKLMKAPGLLGRLY